MLLHTLAFLGGLLTIFSPCVLPVIPFVFARSHLSFYKSTLPTLLGMAFSFSVFALLSVLGGVWVIQANSYGRYAAMLVFTFLGMSLIFPKFSMRLFSPLQALGQKIQSKSNSQSQQEDSFISSLVIGSSLGLLWAPCAGPILGLVLAGAAVQGLSVQSLSLLLAFALGATSSLALAILSSKSLMSRLKGFLGVEEVVKKALGLCVLLAVLGIALGLDGKLLAKLNYLNTNRIEAELLSRLSLGKKSSEGVSDEGPMPSLEGATRWLNSPELRREDLKGKVILVDFWTYSCINCIRTFPYLKTWWQRYKDKGLVIIGVHAPEFAFEKVPENVEKASKDFGLNYPIAIDNELKIWNAFQNQFWPAHYFIDAKGRIRYHHFGEGKYQESEAVLRMLLKEANPEVSLDNDIVSSKVRGEGIEQKAGRIRDIKNPETYLGYERLENFVQIDKLEKDRIQTWQFPVSLERRQWALDGQWQVSAESVDVKSSGSKLRLAFESRDVHLVLSGAKGKRFRVLLDGKAPGMHHGMDIDENGKGSLDGERLYQLIHLKEGASPHILEIEFLDGDISAFAFTFG